ncbi:MAG: ABC transporter ATP-binding protein [Candidatus Kapabacteria bacterium]|nr:ABC transporter ATP-binding protein [Candidatus Kapabacteria bacterium]MCS7169130.1 ABC transporter ATP-binding protein [Candidatus Kapabacteria bacterium]MDW7996985.1 ABC transporter ATP-binding protein [Bacteroidota bacterium]MDW8225419.1 ABC transporter ATP-binding protein [Bacteroidota bacterium]
MIALETHGLGKAYVPGVWVLRDLTLRLEAGAALAVMGPNGAGKTTLVKLLCGLTEPTAGNIWLDIDGQRHSPRECLWWAMGVAGPFLQLYDEFTPWELLSLSTRLRDKRWEPRRAQWLIEQLGLHTTASQRIAVLSSGMQQRVRIALALLHEPVVLVLDEVTAMLDAAGIAAVEKLVRWHCERGGIVVAATNTGHERRWCQHTLELPVRQLA